MHVHLCKEQIAMFLGARKPCAYDLPQAGNIYSAPSTLHPFALPSWVIWMTHKLASIQGDAQLLPPDISSWIQCCYLCINAKGALFWIANSVYNISQSGVQTANITPLAPLFLALHPALQLVNKPFYLHHCTYWLHTARWSASLAILSLLCSNTYRILFKVISTNRIVKTIWNYIAKY